MSETVIREPEQIRQGCAGKLKQVQTSGRLLAIVGHLLGETWAKPRIAELRLSADGYFVARAEGALVFKYALGARDEVIRELHALARSAGLDGDELGYLLARVAGVGRV